MSAFFLAPPSEAGRSVRTRRAMLLLLTIGALLFVGMQSRVAHRIPTPNAPELLAAGGDPVKFPPPEERLGAPDCEALTPKTIDLPEPPLLAFTETPTGISYVGERDAAGNPFRAPPASL